MPNYNQGMIIGHLTRDPEMRSAKSGMQIASGGIAYNDYKKNAHFFDYVAFDKTADLMHNHLRKGDAVGLVYELQQDSWDDKETGQKRSKVKLLVNRVVFIGGKTEGGDRGQQAAPRQSQPRQTRQEPQGDGGDYDGYATSLD